MTAALAKVEELVGDAVTQGARALIGGRRARARGTYYEPTVLADVTPGMRLAQEEIFGPVAPLFRFHTRQRRFVWRTTQNLAWRRTSMRAISAVCGACPSALECGMVGINTGLISTAVAPFGGVKQSGLGREGSRYGIDEYLDMKYLCMGGISVACDAYIIGSLVNRSSSCDGPAM